MANHSSSSAALPPEITVRHKSSWSTWLLAMLGWAVMACLIGWVVMQYFPAKNVNEQFVSGDANSKNKIAVITIAGVIQDGHGFVKHQIDQAYADPDVKAVVVRVNSPGGTVSGSDYIFHHLKKLREERDIPMVVSMGPIAASGGYYVSMAVGDQEKTIFAEPTTTTGSIGVIIPHYNFSKFLEEHGIEDDSIMSHPRKRMLSMSRSAEKNPEEHAEHRGLLKDYVNESFERFKGVILEGRPQYLADNPARKKDEKAVAAKEKQDAGQDEKVQQDKKAEKDAKPKDPIQLLSNGRDLATGEIFSAQKAKQFGLVDEIGFIEAAIERAAELANIKTKHSRVIKYKTPSPWIELPYLNQVEMRLAKQEQILSRLLNMDTAQAYYLSSTSDPLSHTWIKEN